MNFCLNNVFLFTEAWFLLAGEVTIVVEGSTLLDAVLSGSVEEVDGLGVGVTWDISLFHFSEYLSWV